MRVDLYPADSSGCGFYRMRLPAAHIDGTTIHDDGLTLGWRGGRIVDARADADVVVLQRPAKREFVEAIPLLQARGVAVVVDMDDDFASIDPGNRAWGFRAAHEVMLEACRRADMVTVTTPKLAARYGAHGRVQVVPNVVPGDYLGIVGAHDALGWAGSMSTHPNDLQVTGGAVGQAVTEIDCRFRVIGDGDGVREALKLDAEPDVTGLVPVEDYPTRVASLAIGIAPLDDTPFNSAKSALKMLEYAALGVAALGSPTPDNVRVNTEGVGMLARRPRDWYRTLLALSDDAFRADVVAASRAAVAASFTIEGNAWRWEQAWSLALSNRRAAVLMPA